MSIQICAPVKISSSMRADRIAPDSYGGSTISKATVLNGPSSGAIPIQRETADGGMQVAGTTEVIKISEAAEPSYTTTPERVYADAKLLESAEDTIGARTTPRTSAVLDANAAVAPPQIIDRPRPGVTPVPAPVSAPVAPPTQKIRVALSSKTMGKHRVTVRSVAVSESLVVLAYPKDSDNIIEPPISTSDSPIRVDIGGDSFMCVFGGWTAELEGMFLVVMIRSEQS